MVGQKFAFQVSIRKSGDYSYRSNSEWRRTVNRGAINLTGFLFLTEVFQFLMYERFPVSLALTEGQHGLDKNEDSDTDL